MLRDEVVEGVEVAEFLVVHVLHEGAEVRVRADYWRGLGGVDEDGGEFAGLVYTELRAG